MNFPFNKIYICSNFHPSQWYKNISEQQNKALARRLKGTVKKFDTVYNKDDDVTLD